jgi:hypothetical protein
MFATIDYLNSLDPKYKKMQELYSKFPVKNFNIERQKLIKNGRRNYPNGFEILSDGLVNLYLINPN